MAAAVAKKAKELRLDEFLAEQAAEEGADATVAVQKRDEGKGFCGVPFAKEVLCLESNIIKADIFMTPLNEYFMIL